MLYLLDVIIAWNWLSRSPGRNLFDRHSTTRFRVLFGDRFCLGYLALALTLYAIKTREGNLIRELSAPAGEGTVLKINVLGR